MGVLLGCFLFVCCLFFWVFFGGEVAWFSCLLFAFFLACFLVVLLGTNHLSDTQCIFELGCH